MRLTIKGRNIELTPALKQYATEKLTKTTKLSDQIIEITAILSVEKNPSISANQVAEVVVTLNKVRIQAKETSESMYASIDMIVDKIERQIKKHKTKNANRLGASSIRDLPKEAAAIPEEGAEEKLDDDIIQIDVVQEENE